MRSDIYNNIGIGSDDTALVIDRIGINSERTLCAAAFRIAYCSVIDKVDSR